MEIQINREDLFKCIARVQSIIERKSNMPILSTVLLTAKGSDVRVSATDLELGFQQSVPASVAEEGSITVSGRKLFEILKESKAQNFHIKEKEDNWIYISDDVARFKLACLPADEYPVFAEPEGVNTVEANGEIIGEMIDKTIYSVTREESGFKLSGVFTQMVEENGNTFLRMVATDGHRLSKVDKPLKELDALNLGDGILIPKKGMSELNKMTCESGKIHIGFKDKNFIAKRGNLLLIIRLLDNKFPDYKGVIPEESQYRFDVQRMTLLDAMRRMLILSSERYRAVKIILEDDTMEFISTNPDLGEANEKIQVAYRGARMEAGFNPQYFIDILQSMESDAISLGFNDASKPCIITGEADEGFLGLLMPMRL